MQGDFDDVKSQLATMQTNMTAIDRRTEQSKLLMRSTAELLRGL